MSVKDYLNQAKYLDTQINSKLEQITMLRTLSTKVTNTLSDMPGSPNRNTDKMECSIVKIVDMENEIKADIDRLIEMKQNILTLITQLDDTEERALMELRYLSFKTWEQIAVEMRYNIRTIYRIHDSAIKKLSKSATCH